MRNAQETKPSIPIIVYHFQTGPKVIKYAAPRGRINISLDNSSRWTSFYLVRMKLFPNIQLISRTMGRVPVLQKSKKMNSHHPALNAAPVSNVNSTLS